MLEEWISRDGGLGEGMIYSFIFFIPILLFPPFLQFEEMNAELEENKELAQNRHCELEKLRQDFEEVTAQNEKLKVGGKALRGSKTKLFAD